MQLVMVQEVPAKIITGNLWSYHFGGHGASQ